MRSYKKIIQEQADRNPQIKDKILKFYKNPEYFKKIKEPILEEKILDYILTLVKIKNTKMSSVEFLKISRSVMNNK
jgi:FKBP-type peptidyl-prolyl cis-trans isomerase (trigger factor)